MLFRKHYRDIRAEIKPGDIFAFGGNGYVSNIIKIATHGPVSHVGCAMQTKLFLHDKSQPGIINHIIESTSLDGLSGVTIGRLSERIRAYSGQVWYMPLSCGVRAKMDAEAFFNFMLHQEGKQYDYKQAIMSGLDVLDWIGITWAHEDFQKMFCSELVLAALESSGAIQPVNASEITPMDLVRMNIFQDEYYQLKGRQTEIKDFNQKNVENVLIRKNKVQ